MDQATAGMLLAVMVANILTVLAGVIVLYLYGGRLVDHMRGHRYAMLLNQRNTIDAHRAHMLNDMKLLEDTSYVVARKIDEMKGRKAARVPRPPAPANIPRG